jgi:hypothetical protein
MNSCVIGRAYLKQSKSPFIFVMGNFDGVNHCDPPLSPCRAPKTRSKHVRPSSSSDAPRDKTFHPVLRSWQTCAVTFTPGESHADREILCANQGIGIRLASALHPLVLLSLLLSPFSPRLHFPPTSANHAPNPPSVTRASWHNMGPMAVSG